ncbi:dnaJ homolog subfamily A member 3, mitochondrial isoform X2 [Telopea speciosissima]|uniref:dnaJ homolog subfamily A member 3, mitochondrial isoform X2 n=1 Tax=Telopea speciosissima TaxID=54955 RepID=UPI001CC49437|nr:dnaJ homolog subfamily A member 3, mitochondrial isoform X2 [Telopea speciosissima]
MQVYLSVCPSFMEGGIIIKAKAKANLLLGGVGPVECFVPRWRSPLGGRPRSPVVASSAAINGQQNHYTVLGIPATASSADIKKAYRLLARKYHPDVSKDSQASEVFKSIRHAYDVLSNEATRAQYDGALKFQEATGSPWHRSWTDDPNVEDRRVHRWTEVRQQMWRESYRQQFDESENSFEHGETDDENGEEISDDERGPFSEVLKSVFFTIFFMQTLGCRISLTLCSLSALLDKKLDAGYKVGYLIAWILGGRGGILLTLCLSFASWLCGKTSSSLVAVVVVAMWVGANLGRYAPLPQGALITLLYMSVKLQVDLS